MCGVRRMWRLSSAAWTVRAWRGVRREREGRGSRASCSSGVRCVDSAATMREMCGLKFVGSERGGLGLLDDGGELLLVCGED